MFYAGVFIAQENSIKLNQGGFMKNIHTLSYIVLFLVCTLFNFTVVLASENIGNAQDVQSNQVTQNNQANQVINFQDLTFKIGTSKQEFLQLEPIPIFINLANEQSYPVVGHFSVDFSLGAVKLLIAPIGQDLVVSEQQLNPVRVSLKRKNRTIQPKESYQTTEQLTMGLETLFPSLGQYQLQLVMNDATGSQKLYSNKIIVNIIKPIGNSLRAYQYLQTNTKTEYIFSGFYDSRSKEQLEYIANNFADTVYGKQIIFQLAKVSFANKEYEKAINYLEALLKDKDFAFNDEILVNLAQANANLDNKEKAKKYLERLVTDYPNSKHAKIGIRYPVSTSSENNQQ